MGRTDTDRGTHVVLVDNDQSGCQALASHVRDRDVNVSIFGLGDVEEVSSQSPGWKASGGDLRNAIPRESSAIVLVPSE